IENALLAVTEAGRAGQEAPRPPRVRVTCRTEGDLLRVSVEDSGPGIPPHIAPRLFEPFVTGRKREGARSGTGLGLAIARGIVNRHGGAISAGVSATLGGASFQVELPRYQPVLAVAKGST